MNSIDDKYMAKTMLSLIKDYKFWLVFLVLWFALTGLTYQVLAEQTVKTIEYPLTFVAQPSSNTDYSQKISITTPDRIYKILSLEIILKGDYQSSTQVIARVKAGNGQLYDCSPSTWTTPTVNTASYEISFDCTDRIKQFKWNGGEIEVGFRNNKVSQNIKPRIKMTYYNNPVNQINVGGTEYSINETSNYTIFAEIPNVFDAVCQYNVFNTTKNIVRNDLMPYVNNSWGLYSASFENPNGINPIVAGVYMTEVSCVRPLVSRNQSMFFNHGDVTIIHELTNSTGSTPDYETLTSVGTTEVCIDSYGTDYRAAFYEAPEDYLPRPNSINYINDINLYMRTSSGNTSTVNVTLKIWKYNYVLDTLTFLNSSTLNLTFMNTTIQQYSLPIMNLQVPMVDYEVIVADICAVSGTTRTLRFYHTSATQPSGFVREIGGYNESVSFEYRGASEIHVNSPVNISLGNISVGVGVNYTYFDEQFNQTWNYQQNNFTYLQNLINNLLLNMTLNLNYTNSLIINSTNNITTSITNFRNEAFTWYQTLRNDIYACCQRWVDELNKLIPNLNIIDIVPGGSGVTQGNNPSWWQRIIGV